jgi:hypothetical protein
MDGNRRSKERELIPIVAGVPETLAVGMLAPAFTNTYLIDIKKPVNDGLLMLKH